MRCDGLSRFCPTYRCYLEQEQRRPKTTNTCKVQCDLAEIKYGRCMRLLQCRPDSKPFAQIMHIWKSQETEQKTVPVDPRWCPLRCTFAAPHIRQISLSMTFTWKASDERVSPTRVFGPYQPTKFQLATITLWNWVITRYHFLILHQVNAMRLQDSSHFSDSWCYKFLTNVNLNGMISSSASPVRVDCFHLHTAIPRASDARQ